MDTTRFSIALICTQLLLSLVASQAMSQEYKSDDFPSDELIASQAWESPSYRPTRILGKHKVSTDEYQVFYAQRDGTVTEMTVIRLDTGLWYHPTVPALRAGIFAEPKKRQ